MVRASGKPLTEGVPGMFTYDGYHGLFLHELPKVTTLLAKEETWVLGQAEGRRSVAQEVLTGQLANEVKRLYLMEYARLWETFLADIRPIRTASLEQAGEQARLYSSANSSLEQFIRAVARETTLARRPDQQEGGSSGSTSSWLGEKLQRIREEQHQLSRLTGKPLNVGGMLATGTLEADIVDFRFREYRRLATSNGSGPAPITASLQVLNEAAAVIASARQQVEHPEPDAAHGRGAFRRPGGGAGVFNQLHQLRARRHMRAKAFHVVREGGGAECKHQVVPAQQRHDLLAHGRQHTCKQAVVLRKAAPAGHGGDPHGGVVPLGQRQHAVPGAVAVHGGAHHKHGALCAIQRIADGLQHAGLGARLGAHGAGLQRLARLVPVVGRDGHQHRPTRLLHGDVVGAGDGQGYVFGARGLHAPLHVGLGQLGGLAREQEGVERQDGARLLPGRDDHGRAVLVRREDIAHGVAHAGRRVQVHKGRVVRGLGVAVGHAHHHRLLQAEDVAEVRGEVEEQRQLGGAGVAEDGVDVEAFFASWVGVDVEAFFAT
mgnify:CR=1 FL=1